MTISEKKIFRFYRHLNFIAVGVCLFLVFFVSPLKGIVLPHLRGFVTANLDALLNIFWVVFITGSSAMILIVLWLEKTDRETKPRAKQYISRLVAKDYYKTNRRVDYYRAVKTALSKFSAQTPGEEDRVSTVKNTVITPRDKLSQEIAQFQYIDDENEDKSDGTHKYFYPDGMLKKEVTYLNGKMEGIFRTYYQDGTLHLEKVFKDGLLDGVFTAYDEFGIPYFDITFKEGVKHGVENGYFKTGVVEYQEVYEDGKRVSRKSFDEGGELKFKHVSKSQV